MEKILEDIENVDIELKTSNVFGPVKRGALHLNGKLFSVAVLADGKISYTLTGDRDCRA